MLPRARALCVREIVRRRDGSTHDAYKRQPGSRASALALRCRSKGCPLRIPRDRAASVGAAGEHAAARPLGRRSAPASRGRHRVRRGTGYPRPMRRPTVGAAARRTARAPGGGPGGRPSGRPRASSAALPTAGRSGAACGPRFWSRLPALPSLAATSRCQGFRSALDTARTPAAALASAGEATVAPDGRAHEGAARAPTHVQRCGLRAAIGGGRAQVHHR